MKSIVLALLVLAFAALWYQTASAQPAGKAGGRLQATISVEHGYEPASPGLVYSVGGCGYAPNTPVHMVDEVTYATNPYFELSWDTSMFWGQQARIEYDGPVTDANGCIVPFWTQAWGIGNHTVYAYQQVRGRMKEAAYSYYDVAPHNGGPAYMAYSCLFYAPTPTPYLGPVPPDGSLPSNAYACP